jgi:hypothetical protein
MTRLIRSISAVVLTATIAVACSDTVAPADLTVGDLAGAWNATKLEFTNVANSAQVFDLVANGGTFTLTLQSNGQFNGTQSLATLNETFSGTVTVSNAVLTLTDTDSGEVTTFTITAYDGSTITMHSNSNVSWDFGFDGSDEEASMVIVLQKQ